MSDELHASYSRNLANQSVQKGLIKFAKARGLSSPEIWQHNGEWAMRYTGTDGEVKQLSLGPVFAKARSVIASLVPKVALAEPQAVVKELMQRAQAAGLKTARITFDGKNYRMQYGGRLISLGPSRGDAMVKIGKVKPVAASLVPKKLALRKESYSLADDQKTINKLKVLVSNEDGDMSKLRYNLQADAYTYNGKKFGRGGENVEKLKERLLDLLMDPGLSLAELDMKAEWKKRAARDPQSLKDEYPNERDNQALVAKFKGTSAPRGSMSLATDPGAKLLWPKILTALKSVDYSKPDWPTKEDAAVRPLYPKGEEGYATIDALNAPMMRS